MTAAGQRGGLAEDAYALQLAGEAPALLQKLGGEVDKTALRQLKITLMQRVLQHARAPKPADAMLLAQAARAHPEDPVLTRLAERLIQQIMRAQRPDGTFQGSTGWTLQRLMVATAEGLVAVAPSPDDPRALERFQPVRLRAEGAFERSMARVQDPYTAAVVLASSGVEGTLAETFRSRVKDGLTSGENGAQYFSIPDGVVRSDGQRPSDVDGSAWAVLALADDASAKEILPDLGAQLIARYRPGIGWGDGRTNGVALRAILRLFSSPVPERIQVALTREATPLVTGMITGVGRQQVSSWTASFPGVPGPQTWTLEAKPAVPGLGYTLGVTYYVPWETLKPSVGWGLELEPPSPIRVGQPVTRTLRAQGPAHLPLVIRQALPAGVEPDRGSLEQLVQEGLITRFSWEAGEIVWTVPPRTPGQAFIAQYRVVATLAGTLTSGASLIHPEGQPEAAAFVAPSVWRIAPF